VNVIVNSDDQILLLLRAPHLRRAPGKWGFAGGHMEPGEQPAQCSAREMREEIGNRTEVQLLGHIGPVADAVTGAFEVHLFHYRWLDGSVELNDEHTDYAWVSAQEYPNYDVMTGIDDDLTYFGIWS
jgi:8-oxo-dGTP pyrophosphatase MutT (NUDIX family)